MPRSTRSVAYVGRRSEPLPEGYVIPASVMAEDARRVAATADRKAASGRLSSPDRSVRVAGSRPSPWAGHFRPRPLSRSLVEYISAVQDREPGEPLIEPPSVLVCRQDARGRQEYVSLVEPLK